MTGLIFAALLQVARAFILRREMALITMLNAWLMVPIVALSSGPVTGSYLDIWLFINISVLYSLLARYPSNAIRLVAFATPFVSTAGFTIVTLGMLPTSEVVRRVVDLHPIAHIMSTIVVLVAALLLEARSVDDRSRGNVPQPSA